jgi:hypothetical protein
MFNVLKRLLHLVPSRERIVTVLLYEHEVYVYIIEKLKDGVILLEDVSATLTNGYADISTVVDDLVFKLEEKYKSRLNQAIFVLPSLGMDEAGVNVLQPYRRAISELIKNLELKPLGYVELADVVEGKIKTQTYLYAEIGSNRMLLDTVVENKRSRVVYPDILVDKIEEAVAQSQDKSIHLYVHCVADISNTHDIFRAIEASHVHLFTRHDVSLGVVELVRRQLLGTKIPPHDVPEGSRMSSSMQHPTTLSQSQPPPADPSADISADMPETSQSVSQLPVGSTMLDHHVIDGFEVYNATSQKLDERRPPTPLPPPSFTQSSDLQKDTTPLSDSKPTGGKREQIVAGTAVSSMEIVEDRASGDKDTVSTGLLRRSAPAPIVRQIAVSLFAMVCAGVVAGELFFHKTRLEVAMPLRDAVFEFEMKDVPVTVETDTKTLKATVETTGTRTVGERAKGQVLVASFSDSPLTFTTGTKLVTDGKTYQLDAAVTLEPATLNTTSGTKTASKQTVPASATFIGPEGNIQKGKQFQVASMAAGLVYALSESTFSGGTRREVAAVARSDIEKLRSEIQKKAREASNIAGVSDSPSQSARFISLQDVSTVEISTINYSANAGEVADVVDATAEVNTATYLIQYDNLQKELEREVANRYGSMVRVASRSNQPVVKNTRLNTAGDRASFTVAVNTQIFTTLQPSEVATLASGFKTPATLRALMRDRYSATDVRLVPKGPLRFLNITPLRKQNIEVEVVAGEEM